MDKDEERVDGVEVVGRCGLEKKHGACSSIFRHRLLTRQPQDPTFAGRHNTYIHTVFWLHSASTCARYLWPSCSGIEGDVCKSPLPSTREESRRGAK